MIQRGKSIDQFVLALDQKWRRGRQSHATIGWLACDSPGRVPLVRELTPSGCLFHQQALGVERCFAHRWPIAAPKYIDLSVPTEYRIPWDGNCFISVDSTRPISRIHIFHPSSCSSLGVTMSSRCIPAPWACMTIVSTSQAQVQSRINNWCLTN